MAICNFCNKEMLDEKVVSCSKRKLSIDGKKYSRSVAYYDVNKRCHDCNIINGHGHTHHLGCDIERCPIDGRQLISCGHNPKDAKNLVSEVVFDAISKTEMSKDEKNYWNFTTHWLLQKFKK